MKLIELRQVFEGGETELVSINPFQLSYIEPGDAPDQTVIRFQNSDVLVVDETYGQVKELLRAD